MSYKLEAETLSAEQSAEATAIALPPSVWDTLSGLLVPTIGSVGLVLLGCVGFTVQNVINELKISLVPIGISAHKLKLPQVKCRKPSTWSQCDSVRQSDRFLRVSRCSLIVYCKRSSSDLPKPVPNLTFGPCSIISYCAGMLSRYSDTYVSA